MIHACILARNHLATLPYFFGQLEQLDYAKERITLDIRTDHNSDATGEWLSDYAQRARAFYAAVHFDWDEVVEDGDRLDSTPFAWNKNRYMTIVAAKEACRHRGRNADYLLYLDVDVFLTDSKTLQKLIAAHAPVIAPVLRDPFSNYSNFWAGTDANGYYRRTDAYWPILNGEQGGYYGVNKVAMVYGCVLVNVTATSGFQWVNDASKLNDDLLVSLHYIHGSCLRRLTVPHVEQRHVGHLTDDQTEGIQTEAHAIPSAVNVKSIAPVLSFAL